MITLLDQAVLVALYITPEPPIDLDDYGVRASLERLAASALIAREPDRYAVTERGKVYCEAMRAIPLPIQQWVIPAFPTTPPHE